MARFGMFLFRLKRQCSSQALIRFSLKGKLPLTPERNDSAIVCMIAHYLLTWVDSRTQMKTKDKTVCQVCRN